MDMDMRKFESTPSLGIPMSLESLPTDILLELGRYLEVGDIISLRLTSKCLRAFSLMRSLWLISATNVAEKRPLPLLKDFFLSNAPTDDVINATIKASKIHSMLFCFGETGTIRPRGPTRAVRMKTLPEGHDDFYPRWEDDKLFVYNAEYFFVISDGGVALWDSVQGKLIGSADVRAFGLLEAGTLSNDDGTVNVIIASHCTAERLYPRVPSDGQFTITEFLIPNSTVSPLPPRSFSVPIRMTVTGIFLDDHYTVAAGQATGDVPSTEFVLVGRGSNKAVVVDTSISLGNNIVIGVIISSSRLILHAQLDITAHIFIYELDDLLLHFPPIRSTFTRLYLPPLQHRTVPFDLGSSGPPPDYWGAFIQPNLLGTGRGDRDFRPCVTWMHQDHTENSIRIQYHVLDYIFDESHADRTCYNFTIPKSSVFVSDHMGMMLWVFPGGCVAYVSRNEQDELELRLIAFAFDGLRKCSKIELPPFIDLNKLCDIDFNRKWGVLGLVMGDATAYMVNFV